MVEIADTSTRHGLAERSSGEKQILLFLSELQHRWRPGSLRLIDEPEIHLHPSLQLQLFTARLKWRDERGGQLIIATQSNHLFRHASSGTNV